MFNVLDNVTFTRTVTVVIPVDGGVEKLSLPTRFRLLPDDELDDLDISRTDGVKEFLRRVIVDFHDLKDGKAEVPYNDALREKLLKWGPVRTGLLTAYRKALAEGYEGN